MTLKENTMSRLYNFAWNAVTFICLVLASAHLYVHRQEYLNDLMHLMGRF